MIRDKIGEKSYWISVSTYGANRLSDEWARIAEPSANPIYRCHVRVSASRLALNSNPCFFKDQPVGAGL